MLTKKKKLSKKEIREDKLVTSYYKTVQFLDEYKSKVLLYAGALVVVIVLVIIYMRYQEGNNVKANLALSRVLSLYDSGAYQEAIDGRPGTNIQGLKSIVDQYGSTEAGETAKIYLANSYNMLGKFEEAYEYYDDYSGSNDELKAAALAGVGGYYEAKNEPKEAADVFKKAASISNSNPLNADYLLKAGINYLETGDKKEAEVLFQKIKDDYKTSPSARNVDRYLALIK